MPPESVPTPGSAARPSAATAIGAATRTYAILGDPVAHSLSPRLHNAALGAAQLDGVYVALRCGRERLDGLARGLAAAGGGGNVTVPHKRAVADLLDDAGEAVLRTGACNTFWGEDGRLLGDNTDIEGFRRAFVEFTTRMEVGRVLLLGAGGAAAAVLAALLDLEVPEVVLLNRTPTRADELVERVARGGTTPAVNVVDSVEALRGRAVDVAINATSLGLHMDDPQPLALDGPVRLSAVFDLVYGEYATPWVRAAAEQGLRACDGREMLLQQAAASFERWWRRPAPFQAMRAAIGG